MFEDYGFGFGDGGLENGLLSDWGLDDGFWGGFLGGFGTHYRFSLGRMIGEGNMASSLILIGLDSVSPVLRLPLDLCIGILHRHLKVLGIRIEIIVGGILHNLPRRLHGSLLGSHHSRPIVELILDGGNIEDPLGLEAGFPDIGAGLGAGRTESLAEEEGAEQQAEEFHCNDYKWMGLGVEFKLRK